MEFKKSFFPRIVSMITEAVMNDATSLLENYSTSLIKNLQLGNRKLHILSFSHKIRQSIIVARGSQKRKFHECGPPG